MDGSLEQICHPFHSGQLFLNGLSAPPTSIARVSSCAHFLAPGLRNQPGRKSFRVRRNSERQSDNSDDDPTGRSGVTLSQLRVKSSQRRHGERSTWAGIKYTSQGPIFPSTTQTTIMSDHTQPNQSSTQPGVRTRIRRVSPPPSFDPEA
jgi:hypothetical protein